MRVVELASYFFGVAKLVLPCSYVCECKLVKHKSAKQRSAILVAEERQITREKKRELQAKFVEVREGK